MIAITLMIRRHDSSPWLEFVRHHFHRCESPFERVVAAENMPLSGFPWKLPSRHRDWPVALVLAGAPEALELATPQTGGRTALTHIFAGTGSSIRTRCLHCESIR
jgi:hypothetical protein